MNLENKFKESEVGVSLGARVLKRLKDQRKKNESVHFI